jgi:thymidylate synthase
MKQYQELLRNILDNGTKQKNRTEVDTVMLPGAMLKFDLREGFPAVTTKKLFYGAVVGELLGFLRGCNTVKEFNDLGCKVWDANGSASGWINSDYYKQIELKNTKKDFKSNGFLGRIYGVQWRNWIKSSGGNLDQIKNLITEIKVNPTSRRLLVTAWRPDELYQMALPPCHYGFQVIIEQETRTMHLLWNQRSCDVFLGIPFNIASYATLLHLLARVTGYNVGTLTGFLADVHIYENHIEQVKEQLGRDPLALCEINISDRITENFDLKDVNPGDINLVGYKSYPSIKAEMAV